MHEPLPSIYKQHGGGENCSTPWGFSLKSRLLWYNLKYRRNCQQKKKRGGKNINVISATKECLQSGSSPGRSLGWFSAPTVCIAKRPSEWETHSLCEWVNTLYAYEWVWTWRLSSYRRHWPCNLQRYSECFANDVWRHHKQEICIWRTGRHGGLV